MPDPLSTPVRPSTRAVERPAGSPAAHESPGTLTGPQTPVHGVRLSASQITDDDLDALYAERDALLDELAGRDDEARERWIEKQLAETGLRSMDFRNGMHMDIEPARDLVAHWVGAARSMLGDAPNYTETPIEMEVKVAEAPERFAFVLQRVAHDALTPHQARQRAEAERDQARDIAIALEQQLAAVAALHVDSHTTRGVGRATDTPPDHWTPYCEHDGQDWPCATTRAINPEEQPAPAEVGGAA